MERHRDPAAQRLAQLLERLGGHLGDGVDIEVTQLEAEVLPGGRPLMMTSIAPARSDALALSWIEIGDEIVLETGSGLGGRWELGRSDADIEFLEDIVWSVVLGRVREVFGRSRSRIIITLTDGTEAVETGADGLRGCLPQPLWTRRGRTVSYSPY